MSVVTDPMPSQEHCTLHASDRSTHGILQTSRRARGWRPGGGLGMILLPGAHLWSVPQAAEGGSVGAWAWAFLPWPDISSGHPTFSTGNLAPKAYLPSPAQVPIPAHRPLCSFHFYASLRPSRRSPRWAEVARAPRGCSAWAALGYAPRPQFWLCKDGMESPKRGGTGETHRRRDEFKVASVESSSPTTSFSCLPV